MKSILSLLLKFSRVFGLATLFALSISRGHTENSFLKPGSRLAIVGDSITEQKQYSRFIETYLTVCHPELKTTVFQFGWGGERVPGFLGRMDQDLAYFKPTHLTLCYGMNDGQYKAYEASVGDEYKKGLTQIVEKLKSASVAVVVGGPGAVDRTYFKRCDSTVYNQTLEKLSGLALEVATANQLRHAEIHRPMMEAVEKAKAALGESYDVCGPDGFHPNPNGHLVMASAFLKSFGIDGDLGTITFDLDGTSSASGGHRIESSKKGELQIKSSRYPYCFSGDPKSSSSSLSIVPFVPFQNDFNRFTLRVVHAKASSLRVSWGSESKVFKREELEKGINLSAEFISNPFQELFLKVDAKVGQKQAFETQWIKSISSAGGTLRKLFPNDEELKGPLRLIDQKMLREWEKLNQEIQEEFKPLVHTIQVEPVS